MISWCSSRETVRLWGRQTVVDFIAHCGLRKEARGRSSNEAQHHGVCGTGIVSNFTFRWRSPRAWPLDAIRAPI